MWREKLWATKRSRFIACDSLPAQDMEYGVSNTRMADNFVKIFSSQLGSKAAKDVVNMKMPFINNKITWPLLAALLGATVGALSGQFAWALIAAAGLWAMASVAQNLSAFRKRINGRNKITTVGTDCVMPRSRERSSDWFQEWEEDMHYSPAYKGTPGNIWNGPKWTSDD